MWARLTGAGFLLRDFLGDLVGTDASGSVFPLFLLDEEEDEPRLPFLGESTTSFGTASFREVGDEELDFLESGPDGGCIISETRGFCMGMLVLHFFLLLRSGVASQRISGLMNKRLRCIAPALLVFMLYCCERECNVAAL